MVAPTPSSRAQDNPVDILLVDSRQLVRAGVERVLSDSGHLTVSHAVANCEEAIRLARRQQPQLIMINLPVPGHKGSPFDKLTYRELQVQTEVELMHLAISQGLVKVNGAV